MPVLFDSSLYITALRAGGEATLLLQRWARETPLWLSSVVLAELYAGTKANDYRIRAKRLLVPNLSDWTHAGKILARLSQKYGYERIGQTRLTNDGLIAASAARLGITVLTANQRDFARLAEFCPLQWQTRVVGEH